MSAEQKLHLYEDANASGRIELDESQWPILQVRFVGDISETAATNYFNRVRELLDQHEPYVTISLIDEMDETANQVIRRATAVFSSQYREEIEQFALGAVIVVSSSVVRVALRAYLLFSPMPVPTKVVGNVNDAMTVARSLLVNHR